MNDPAKEEEGAPRLSPPTEEELKLLPLRALVAHAARCARRAEALYLLPSGHPDTEGNRRAIHEAIQFAEDFASGGVIDIMPAFLAAKRAERAAEAAKAVPDAIHSMFSAYSACYAAWAAHVAATELTSSSVLGIRAFEIAQEVGKQKGKGAGEARAQQFLVPTRGSYTARFVATSCVCAANASPMAIGEIWNDYQKLLSLDLGTYPELGNPIDPSVDGLLGPFWPDGAPQWYAVDQNHPFYDEILQFFVSTITLTGLLQASLIDKATRKGDSVIIEETPTGKQLSIPLPNPRAPVFMDTSHSQEMFEFSPAATVEYLFGNAGRPTQLLFAIRPSPTRLADESTIGGQLEAHVGAFLETLVCYLVGGGYERYKDRFKARYGKDFKKWHPELQFFRHLRNGCFHGNVFTINPNSIVGSNRPTWHTYRIPSENAVNGDKVMDGFFRTLHVVPLLHDMGRFA